LEYWGPIHEHDVIEIPALEKVTHSVSSWTHPYINSRIIEQLVKFWIRSHLICGNQDAVGDISSLVWRIGMSDQVFSANTP
jgi:hypothetical protein